MNKKPAYLLVLILAASSLITIEAMTVFASAFQPSVPEFTVKFVADPYFVPTIYGIDSFTGKNVTIQESHRVENNSVEITIKNQHVPNDFNLLYNVRYKGHFGKDWVEIYSLDQFSAGNLPAQSTSEYTVLSIPVDYPDGFQVDYQVEAISWNYAQVFVSDHPALPAPYNQAGHYEARFAIGETSEWSNAQTITSGPILPSVTLLLPHEAKFNTSEVPLDFAVAQQVSQINYSLDGRENVTITGNTTLTGLPNGNHNVTVYVTDEAGNTGASENILFTVEAPELFPTLQIVAIVIFSAIVVCVALLVYFRKYRNAKKPNN